MGKLVQYKRHYEVFIDWEEDPIQISHEWWETLKAMLRDKDCPYFIPIGKDLYNRFKIGKVKEFEEKYSEDQISAIREHEEFISKLKSKNG